MLRSFLTIAMIGLLLSTDARMIAAAAAQNAGPASSQVRHWTADNGNGTYSNPLFYDEFSDPDMIRVGSDYYLTGTTMHVMPGLPVRRGPIESNRICDSAVVCELSMPCAQMRLSTASSVGNVSGTACCAIPGVARASTVAASATVRAKCMMVGWRWEP